ncbi:MAG: DUF177 domain-containing protein [Candidatus Omnitrophica bacterium]|nr:DUF177 domain-containing protein [Candidatus Omnitrophota bacterium]
MRIDLTAIPAEGLTIDTTYDPDLLELNIEYLRYEGPVAAHIQVAKNNRDISVRVTMSYATTLTCSRCLENYTQEMNKTIDLFYAHVSEHFLDITNDIRNEIFMEYPLKPLCASDCKGLCATCGQNLNTGTCEHNPSQA